MRKRERRLILCACGCNELIPNISKNGYYAKFKHGHNSKGNGTHPNWKGGRTVNPQGYVLIKRWDHPYSGKYGYIREHRLVMEEYLGRYLTNDEDIHHINGNKQDNRIENLQLMSNSEHVKLHLKQRWAKV